MSTAPATHNGGEAELKRRIDRRLALLDEIVEIQAELKLFKAEDKDDGYNEKAIAAAIKSLRQGPEYHAAQLTLEAEIDTYRRAAGLETDLESAQAKVRAAKAAAPDAPADKPRRTRRQDD